MEAKYVIDAKEVAEFVEGVVDMCVRTNEDGEFEYLPHYKDFAQRIFALRYYADMTFENDDEAISAAYGKLYDTLMDRICCEQHDSIITAINDRIRFLIERNKLSHIDRLAEAFEHKAGLDEIVDKVIEAVDKLSDSFEGVDMVQFASDIHDMKFNGSSETLVDALIKSKMIKTEE